MCRLKGDTLEICHTIRKGVFNRLCVHATKQTRKKWGYGEHHNSVTSFIHSFLRVRVWYWTNFSTAPWCAEVLYWGLCLFSTNLINPTGNQNKYKLESVPVLCPTLGKEMASSSFKWVLCSPQWLSIDSGPLLSSHCLSMGYSNLCQRGVFHENKSIWTGRNHCW